MKIALLGDIGLFGRFRASNPYASMITRPICEQLAGYDIVLGNLETPVAGGGRPSGGKSAYLSCVEQDIGLLHQLGVTHVTLANNHIFDYGATGLKATIEALERHGINWFGTTARPHIDVVSAGQRIRLLGYCAYDTNPIGLIGGVLTPLSSKRLLGDLAAAWNDHCFPVVSAHFGIEHRSFPTRRYREFWKAAARKYPLILHGHHPHVLQPIDHVERSLLAYSLGNFCFDDIFQASTGMMFLARSELNKISAIVSIDIVENRIKQWTAYPIRDGDQSLYWNDKQAIRYFDDITARLADNAEACDQYADEQRRNFVQERRARRDLPFYIERLRPRYAMMLARALLNARLHNSAMAGRR